MEFFMRKSLSFISLFLLVTFLFVSFDYLLSYLLPQGKLDTVLPQYKSEWATGSCFTECIGL